MGVDDLVDVAAVADGLCAGFGVDAVLFGFGEVAIQGDRIETRTEATARRLRGALAEIKMSARQLSMQLGVSYTWMSRRVNAKTPMTVEDLDAIERATGISAVYLLAGHDESRRPVGPNGGSSEGWYTPRDSNPEPTVYSSGRALATVTALPKRPTPARDLAELATVTVLRRGRRGAEVVSA